MKNLTRFTSLRVGETILIAKIRRTLHRNISKCSKNKSMLLSVNVVFKLRLWIILEPSKTSNSSRLTISNLRRLIFSRESKSSKSLTRDLRSIEKNSGNSRVMILDTMSTLRRCKSLQEWILVLILKAIKIISITSRNLPNTIRTGKFWPKIMLNPTTEPCTVYIVSTLKPNF